MRVDLPAPLSPISPTISFLPTAKSMSRSAWIGAEEFLHPLEPHDVPVVRLWRVFDQAHFCRVLRHPANRKADQTACTGMRSWPHSAYQARVTSHSR